MEESQRIALIKPQFNGEIQAKIKSVGEIESNMQEVKAYVQNLNKYYKNVPFNEETIKEAKEEKAKINKFKNIVSDYRKNIVSEYKKPINLFEDTSKETEKLLEDTYKTINVQVSNFEDKQKQQKEKEIQAYFEEYKISKNIDFIKYEQAKINVTITASVKSLKEQAKTFIDKIENDLNLIETQEHKAEILVEYKQTLNVSQSITTVINRFKAIEEEKKKQEEKVVHIEMNENHEITKRTYEELENVFNKPLQQPKEEKQEDILTINFKASGTRTLLKELKKFMDERGIKYE